MIERWKELSKWESMKSLSDLSGAITRVGFLIVIQFMALRVLVEVDPEIDDPWLPPIFSLDLPIFIASLMVSIGTFILSLYLSISILANIIRITGVGAQHVVYWKKYMDSNVPLRSRLTHGVVAAAYFLIIFYIVTGFVGLLSMTVLAAGPKWLTDSLPFTPSIIH